MACLAVSDSAFTRQLLRFPLSTVTEKGSAYRCHVLNGFLSGKVPKDDGQVCCAAMTRTCVDMRSVRYSDLEVQVRTRWKFARCNEGVEGVNVESHYKIEAYSRDTRPKCNGVAPLCPGLTRTFDKSSSLFYMRLISRWLGSPE